MFNSATIVVSIDDDSLDLKLKTVVEKYKLWSGRLYPSVKVLIQVFVVLSVVWSLRVEKSAGSAPHGICIVIYSFSYIPRTMPTKNV